MNAAEALKFIVERLQPDDDPALSADTVAELLALAVAADADGFAPTDDAWTPTYSPTGCYRAIAEGWAIKRSKVPGRYDFTTDGQMFRRSQMVDHIENERRRWQAKVQTSPSTLGAAS